MAKITDTQKVFIGGKVGKELEKIVKKNNNDRFIIAGAEYAVTGIGQMFSSFDTMDTQKECKQFKNMMIKKQKQNAPTETGVVDLINYSFKLYIEVRFK